jgi:hypothetical protein
VNPPRDAHDVAGTARGAVSESKSRLTTNNLEYVARPSRPSYVTGADVSQLARPERLLAGFARSSLARRSGQPARLRARRPTRLADSPGCRTPGRLRRRLEFDRLTARKGSADWTLCPS